MNTWIGRSLDQNHRKLDLSRLEAVQFVWIENEVNEEVEGPNDYACHQQFKKQDVQQKLREEVWLLVDHIFCWPCSL